VKSLLPPTLTRNHGVFSAGGIHAGAWRYELGITATNGRIFDADGQPQHRSKREPRYLAVQSGPCAPAVTRWVSRCRAPSAAHLPEELYAYGPHAASRTVSWQYRAGDEKTSNNAERPLRKLRRRTHLQLQLFRNQVDDFIFAADTGRDIGGGYREESNRQAGRRTHRRRGLKFRFRPPIANRLYAVRRPCARQTA